MGLWSVRDGEASVDEGLVLEGVDDRGGVVTDRDAALALLVSYRGVAGLGAVVTGFLSWHQMQRRRAHVRSGDGGLRRAQYRQCLGLVAGGLEILRREVRGVHEAMPRRVLQAAAATEEH
jgi:hypothetical protein